VERDRDLERHREREREREREVEGRKKGSPVKAARMAEVETKDEEARASSLDTDVLTDDARVSVLDFAVLAAVDHTRDDARATVDDVRVRVRAKLLVIDELTVLHQPLHPADEDMPDTFSMELLRRASAASARLSSALAHRWQAVRSC